MTAATNPLAATRRTLHGVAEQILSAHARRSDGSIHLFVTVRGFETRPVGADVIALTDGMLHRRPRPPVPLAGTFADLADALGVPFGMPDPPYRLSSGITACDAVVVDPPALDLLVDTGARGAQALRLVASRHQLDQQEPPLWPEHFDVGLAVGQVNLGVSPGDDLHDAPYAYIGPWTRREGSFWNAPFGALRPMSALPDVEALVDYFEYGLQRAATSPPGSPRST